MFHYHTKWRNSGDNYTSHGARYLQIQDSSHARGSEGFCRYLLVGKDGETRLKIREIEFQKTFSSCLRRLSLIISGKAKSVHHSCHPWFVYSHYRRLEEMLTDRRDLVDSLML